MHNYEISVQTMVEMVTIFSLCILNNGFGVCHPDSTSTKTNLPEKKPNFIAVTRLKEQRIRSKGNGSIRRVFRILNLFINQIHTDLGNCSTCSFKYEKWLVFNGTHSIKTYQIYVHVYEIVFAFIRMNNFSFITTNFLHSHLSNIVALKVSFLIIHIKILYTRRKNLFFFLLQIKFKRRELSI